jgi:dolichol-phosphate mannosyltransferase
MSKLSIIVPVYFNAPTLVELHEELVKVADKLAGAETEMIFVDDGSGDNSFEVLSSLAKRDGRCRVVKLSRNYGSAIAIAAGLEFSTGDCAVIVSADLQDPPLLIEEMYRSWTQGYSIVLGVRRSRKDPLLSKFFSALNYFLIRRFGIKDIPKGGTDFVLYDRKIINVLEALTERNSNLLIHALRTGYSRRVLYYDRLARKEGKSRWTFSKKLKFFIDTFTAFSYFPLRLVSAMGFVVAGIGFLYALLIVTLRLLYGDVVEGWASLMVVVLVVSGGQLIGIGTIGEYLWRVLEEVRRRPTFLIEKTIGFDKPQDQ